MLSLCLSLSFSLSLFLSLSLSLSLSVCLSLSLSLMFRWLFMQLYNIENGQCLSLLFFHLSKKVKVIFFIFQGFHSIPKVQTIVTGQWPKYFIVMKISFEKELMLSVKDNKVCSILVTCFVLMTSQSMFHFEDRRFFSDRISGFEFTFEIQVFSVNFRFQKWI